MSCNKFVNYKSILYICTMNYKIEILRQYEKEGWIYSQVHPSLPLIIWNYTDMTQYSVHWDEITLNCRGLVTDFEGHVISKGFKKFFNHSENRTNIPSETDYIEVWEKMDGSYIGLFYYADRWIINSKGSFQSEQVLWAEEILKKLDLETLNKNWTYCFELIVPQNRIVCNYGDENTLYFLSAFCNGEEVESIHPTEFEGTVIKFPHLMQLNTFKPQELIAENKPNEEGYVVKFSNGERCKLKFEEYVKLHSLYTRSSSYDIYDCLKNGQDIKEVLKDAPDEIYGWIDTVKSEIEITKNELKSTVLKLYEKVESALGECNDKEFALFVKDNEYKGYLFNLRRNKDIEQQLWKDCKPEYKTFSL